MLFEIKFNLILAVCLPLLGDSFIELENPKTYYSVSKVSVICVNFRVTAFNHLVQSVIKLQYLNHQYKNLVILSTFLNFVFQP